MGRKADDLTGKYFGKLTAIRRIENNKDNKAVWLCQCECGNIKAVAAAVLKRGDTVSCGCMRGRRGDLPTKPVHLRRTHRNRLYNVWANMKNRCYMSSASSYSYYGGRGIQVCEKWKEDFDTFVEWALSHGYADGMEIDRIDTDGDYCEENCRWISHIANSRNRKPRRSNLPPGVVFRPSRTGIGGKWRSNICVNGKNISIGTFETQELAAQARKAAEIEYWGDSAP